MIYTCTFNPALDYKFQIDQLEIGSLNRIENEYYEIGGKGIMVSKLLNNLGVSSSATGFLAGFVGEHIHTVLKEFPFIQDSFVQVDGNSRINIKLKHVDQETEINGSGPLIPQSAFDKIIQIVKEAKVDDYFIISGSTPNGIPNAYEQLTKACKEHRGHFIIDTSGRQLLDSLVCNPLLIKPNDFELQQLFQKSLDTEDELIHACKELVLMGAQNVLLSRGGDGALFVNQDKIYKLGAPKGVVQSTTGAGDSMLAGFVAKYIETKDYKEAFKFSVAAGSATAFSKLIATKDEILSLVDQLNVEEL